MTDEGSRGYAASMTTNTRHPLSHYYTVARVQAGSQRATILRELHKRPKAGLTAYELSGLVGTSPNQVAARMITDLVGRLTYYGFPDMADIAVTLAYDYPFAFGYGVGYMGTVKSERAWTARRAMDTLIALHAVAGDGTDDERREAAHCLGIVVGFYS